MAYTDIATIRGWLKDITSAKVPDSEITACIALGDRWVDMHFAKWPTMLVDLPATEDFIKAIAECATNAFVYQRAYSRDQEAAENEDRIMWENQRKELLDGFLAARIRASSGPATQQVTTNASADNRYPFFGYAKWSQRVLSDTQPDAETGYSVVEQLP